MKCPRCGSGDTQGMKLGNENWLRRYFCNVCHHAWVDQIGPRPPEKPKGHAWVDQIGPRPPEKPKGKRP